MMDQGKTDLSKIFLQTKTVPDEFAPLCDARTHGIVITNLSVGINPARLKDSFIGEYREQNPYSTPLVSIETYDTTPRTYGMVIAFHDTPNIPSILKAFSLALTYEMEESGLAFTPDTIPSISVDASVKTHEAMENAQKAYRGPRFPPA